MDGWHLGCGKRSLESCMALAAINLCRRASSSVEHWKVEKVSARYQGDSTARGHTVCEGIDNRVVYSV